MLAGKTAIVTGGSRGLGFAIAELLARNGARVALLARTEAPLVEAAEKIGSGTIAVPTDISDADSVRAAFERVDDEFGRLDILVNNAVLARPRKLADCSDADLDDMVGTNLMGVLYCMRAAIAPMRAGGGGQIVNVSSEAVRNPFPLLSIYVTTKAAVEMLSVGIKRELLEDGIRVSVLRAGAMTGAGFIAGWSEEETQAAVKLWLEGGFLQFVGTPMRPESVAESVLHIVTRPPGVGADLVEIRSA